MSAKPITPAEVAAKKATTIPDGVIEAFNEVIAKHWDGRRSNFKLKDAVAAVCLKMGVNREWAFEQKWFDVEPIYELSGWKVEFDKPGYCESYDANYTFTRRK